jgi:hypothetical protein
MKKKTQGLTNRYVKRKQRGWTLYVICTFSISIFFLLLSVGLLFLYYSKHLPDFEPLKERPLNAYSVVYSEQD